MSDTLTIKCKSLDLLVNSCFLGIKSRVLLILLLIVGCISLGGGETNIYQGIIKRNAFGLTASLPVPTLPSATNILSPSVFLTGISRLNGVRKVHLVLKKSGELNKYVSLATDQKQYNIKLNKIFNYSVEITNNGVPTLLSFEKNGLPTTITKPAAKPTERSGYSRESRESRGSHSDKRKK